MEALAASLDKRADNCDELARQALDARPGTDPTGHKRAVLAVEESARLSGKAEGLRLAAQDARLLLVQVSAPGPLADRTPRAPGAAGG